MVGRALVAWLMLAFVVVFGGALRAALLEPRVGESAAHLAATITVTAVFAWLLWRTVPWVCPRLGRRSLLCLGVLWVSLTVLFELAFGHYVLGESWGPLFASYDVRAGRPWGLALITILAGPLIVGRLRATPHP